MKKFREVDLHSYLEKYNFQNMFLNLSERNIERFENKYKKFGLDRNKYTYDEFLLDKMDSIILLIEHCQPLIDKEFNLISNDTRPFSIDFKVNNLIFDLKRIFFKKPTKITKIFRRNKIGKYFRRNSRYYPYFHFFNSCWRILFKK